MNHLDKNHYRKIYKQKRKSINRESYEKSSSDVCKKIFHTEAYKKAETIFGFYPLTGEVDIKPVLTNAASEKNLYLPKVSGKTMFAVPVKDISRQVRKGTFGIMEPLPNKKYSGKIDLVLVPGLVFSRSGHRIGYGGGFYDRFLKDYQKRFGNLPYTIGCLFPFQLDDTIPFEDHDIAVNEVMT